MGNHRVAGSSLYSTKKLTRYLFLENYGVGLNRKTILEFLETLHMVVVKNADEEVERVMYRKNTFPKHLKFHSAAQMFGWSP